MFPASFLLAVLGAVLTADPAASPLSAASPPTDWILVHGDTRSYGGLSLQRIGDVYLRQASSWQLVDAADADAHRPASRFLVGTPDDNAAIRALAPRLGVRIDDGALRWGSTRLGPGAGLVLVTDDPDGEGRLWLMTGTDDAGVWACFTVPVDLSRHGVTFASEGRVLEPTMPDFETSRPALVRLDRDFADLLAAGEEELGRVATFTGPADEDGASADLALRIARGLVGHAFVYEAAASPGLDLYPYVFDLLTTQRAALDAALDYGASRDLGGRLLDLHARCVDAFGPSSRPAPVYFVLLAGTDVSNAKNFGTDPVTGRTAVLLNLTMMPDDVAFDLIAAHETIHTLQEPRGQRLIDRAVQEGVATYLSQQLLPSTSDAVALMWTEEELAAARAHHDALLAAFRNTAEKTDPSWHSAFLTLGKHHAAAPQAPSRTGYYLGWLAARAWDAANDGPARDLLDAPSDDIFAALPGYVD